MSTIGSRLAQAREEKGWSQQDLAEKSGVSQTTISHIESGRNNSSKHLPRLAKTCGVQTDWLAANEGPKYPGIAEPGAKYGSEDDRLAAVEQLFRNAPKATTAEAIKLLTNFLIDKGVNVVTHKGDKK
jgi:transcriptional regulator with XRE-family HTH domain